MFAGSVTGGVDPYEAKRSYGGVLYDTPVYDPISKSYFELIKTPGPAHTYRGAMKFAKMKKFKGIRGRLAIIRSRETQQFLNRTLRPKSEAWIGLRMFCHRRVLFWSDGKIHNRRKGYVNWGPKWHYAKDFQPCKRGQKYAGVTLAPIGQAGYAGKGLRWFAIAPTHGVKIAIIEYPTGGQ